MDYSSGDAYGYDEINANPFMNRFDAPYMQVKQIYRDEPYYKAATGAYQAPPYKMAGPTPRATLDTHAIPGVVADEDDTFCANAAARKVVTRALGGDSDLLMLVLVVLLLYALVTNTIRIRDMRSQINDMNQYLMIYAAQRAGASS